LSSEPFWPDSIAFRPATVGWLALSTGAVIALVVAVAFAMRERGHAQRVFDGFMFVIAAWTIVSSRVFSGAREQWLAFASAAALGLLAVVGLIVHEVLMELAPSRDRGREVEAQPSERRVPRTLGAAG
jgi:prolipoprotein diacylglyceryltransferase